MRLGDVLDEARHRTFVGRSRELAAFDDALGGRSPRGVFLVHGVGGIGKSTLLGEFRAHAMAAGRPAVLIDGREVDPSPDGVRAALARALPGPSAGLGDLHGAALLIDHYEQLTATDAWMRRELLPELPDDAVAVLAGRDAPDPAWRRLPGWRDLGVVFRLDSLSEAESAQFLVRSGVPPERHAGLVPLSRGHPLALALLADAAAEGPLPETLADAPDLVSALLEGVVSQIPGEAYAVGLATCTVAWSTTEDLLAETVGDAAPEVWDWLARQPYVARGPRGLVLHDLARDVLTAELERRSPERQRRLHRIVHDRVVGEIRAATGPDRQHAAEQLLYLHRHSPLTSTFWMLRSSGSTAVVPAAPEDGVLLARDGHHVTVLERDPAAPPPPDQAWERWDRPGVGQFRQLHFMLSRWRVELQEALPDVLDDLVAAGGLRLNVITSLPEQVRGPVRPDDDRFDTVTARRSVLEAVLAAVAARTPGLDIRRGVAVTGFVAGAPASPGVPHVAGVHAAGGERIAADLVVDCRGRRARVADWLAAIGARPPAEERQDSGFVYYSRHFRSASGDYPVATAPLLQHYAPFSLVTLPADNGTWSVGIVTSSADRALRGLRDPRAWHAALARCPMAAHWAGGEPFTDVDVMAGLEDRYRRLVVDGEPVVTGLVLVGDAWARTNPALGRGTSIGAVHARAVQQVLREVDLADADKVVRRVDDATAATVEPLYRATLAFDRHRLAELAGEMTGRPYETDDPGWAMTKALTAAALADPDARRLFARMALLVEPADQLFSDPAVVARIRSLGASAPRHPLPGPSRAEVLDAIG